MPGTYLSGVLPEGVPWGGTGPLMSPTWCTVHLSKYCSLYILFIFSILLVLVINLQISRYKSYDAVLLHSIKIIYVLMSQ